MENNQNTYRGNQSGFYSKKKSNTKRIMTLIGIAIGILLVLGIVSNASSEPLIQFEELKGVNDILCDKAPEYLYQQVRAETEKEQPDNALIEKYNALATQECHEILNELFTQAEK